MKRCEERLDGGGGVYDKECGRPAVVKEKLLGRSLDKWLCVVHARMTSVLLRGDLKEAEEELRRLAKERKSWIKSLKREIARLKKTSK